jgi:hypothetical protein
MAFLDSGKKRAYQREWAEQNRTKNPERVKAAKVKYRLKDENKKKACDASKAYYRRNRETVLAREAKRRKVTHSAHVKAIGRNSKLKQSYGITAAVYDLLLILQNGVCAVCRCSCISGRRLAVDHCHVTNKVRGLLCANCNRALGLLKDDPLRLRAAADYLEKFGRPS